MNEKIYKTMGRVLMIVSGAGLLKRRGEIMF